MALPARSLFLVVTSLAASVTLGADYCKFNAERSGGIDLSGVAKVVILAGAGDLEVLGSANAKRIEARGKACASSQKVLDETLITVRCDGNIATITTDLPDLDSNEYASIDLGVALPAALPVEVTDSSGDAELRDLKSLTIQDSSGDIRVTEVKGSVTVDSDSSGRITVADIGGDFTVTDDSSGGVKFENVTGRVAVP